MWWFSVQGKICLRGGGGGGEASEASLVQLGLKSYLLLKNNRSCCNIFKVFRDVFYRKFQYINNFMKFYYPLQVKYYNNEAFEVNMYREAITDYQVRFHYKWIVVLWVHDVHCLFLLHKGMDQQCLIFQSSIFQQHQQNTMVINIQMGADWHNVQFAIGLIEWWKQNARTLPVN